MIFLLLLGQLRGYLVTHTRARARAHTHTYIYIMHNEITKILLKENNGFFVIIRSS